MYDAHAAGFKPSAYHFAPDHVDFVPGFEPAFAKKRAEYCWDVHVAEAKSRCVRDSRPRDCYMRGAREMDKLVVILAEIRGH